MIKVTPYNIQQKGSKTAGNAQTVPIQMPPNFTATITVPTSIASDTFLKTQFAPEWLKDATILKATSYLKDVEFDKNDVKQLQAQGSMPPFLSGREAIEFIENSNIRIKFDALASPHIHAQYDFENNFIKINEIYKNTQDPAEILAISEAIFHEAGHAKDGDGESSIQEEIDCLSLNALSHRYFVKKFPNVFSNADSLIVKDGVCVYADLFFDKDPMKTALAKRVRQKYGFLPAGDFKHPPSNLALKSKTS